MREILVGLSLLEDIRFELAKASNEDATQLTDRIDDLIAAANNVRAKDVPEVAKILGYRTKDTITVRDYIPEFIEALEKQLESDHARWGNTWLNRTKEGQEGRTRARYDDYFDMFEQAGIPLPWLKVIGGALICWIREQHLELCPDAKPYGAIGVKVSEEGVKEILSPDNPNSSAGIVAPFTYEGDGAQHKSDCAVHNEPALPKSECDCYECNLPEWWEKCDGQPEVADDVPDTIPPGMSEAKAEDEKRDVIKEDVPVEEMTTKELVESPSRPACHVTNEQVLNFRAARLGYSPQQGQSGKIIRESIIFTRVKAEPEKDTVVVGKCTKDGTIIPTSRDFGVAGLVAPNGTYQIVEVMGLAVTDKLYVSYDYETPTEQ